MVKMNKTIGLSLIWMEMVLLMSCNSEVFVEDFRSDVHAAHLRGTNDSITLSFGHDEWTVIGHLSHSTSEGSSDFHFIIYDAAGEKLGESSQVEMVERGRVELRDELIQLDVARLKDHELVIKVHENLLSDCKLRLTLQHKEAESIRQEILVRLDPAVYELDQIHYTLDSWNWHEREEQTLAMRVVTPYDKPTSFTFYPYAEEHRKVQFSGFYLYRGKQQFYEYFSPFHLFGTAVEVEIPTYRSDGLGFEMKGHRALLVEEVQRFTLSDAGKKDTVVVQGPGSFNVYKWVNYHETINACEIEAHNRVSGTRRLFRGLVTQEQPIRLTLFTQKQEDQG